MLFRCSRLLLLLSLLCAQVAAIAAADTSQLDIGLAVFDAGIPEDPTHHKELGIFPRIREAEAQYLPFALRQALVETNQWGPVRVLPEADASAELLISGRIIKSDGISLEIQIQAVDSRGQEWVNKTYSETASDAVYLSGQNSERPFQKLYQQFAADIYAVGSALSPKEIETISNLSLLRYAAGLAPEAFASYFEQAPEGHYRLLRLPAQDDPMIKRIQRVREQEYIFIDTVDEQYATLFSNMAPTYDLWRQYNREQSLYKEAHEDRIAGRSKKRRGSYDAMKQTYNNYRWSKIQQQESARLATGFDNEVAPTVMKLQGRVVELEGSLEDQYREWRNLLHSIYELETGGGA